MRVTVSVGVYAIILVVLLYCGRLRMYLVILFCCLKVVQSQFLLRELRVSVSIGVCVNIIVLNFYS